MNLPACWKQRPTNYRGTRAHTHGHTIVARGKVWRSRSSMGETIQGPSVGRDTRDRVASGEWHGDGGV